MTQPNQEFSVTAGDAAQPIFTVSDQNGAAINISTVNEIAFTAQETVESSPVITKTKTAAGITLVGGGTTGQFQVALVAADTASLAGYFLFNAKITDASGNVSTVSSGTLRIIRSVPA